MWPSNIYSQIIAYRYLLNFYRHVFSIKKIFSEGFNIITKGASSFPVTINIIINNKCNFNCTMCYWNGTRNSLHINDEEGLSIDDIDKFMSQVKDYRPLIHIGGGEPFMRKDLLEILAIIKRNGLKYLITTNGFLMDEGIVEEMIKIGIDILIVSLYGWGGLHDEITGVEGSFKRTIENLKSLLQKRTKDTKVFVSTLPLPKNIYSLKELVRNSHALGIDGVKIEHLNFLTLKERAKSLENEGDFNFLPLTFIREDCFNKDFAQELIRIYREICQSYNSFVFIKPHLTERQLMRWYTSIPEGQPRCLFLTHSLFVDYNGAIIPCQFFSSCVLGNIKRDSIESIWNSKAYKMLGKIVTDYKPVNCRRCCKN